MGATNEQHGPFPDVAGGWWYLAHPKTVQGPDGAYILQAEEANFQLCCQRAAHLIDLNYHIYAPICHTYSIERASLRLLYDLGAAQEFWYKYDAEFIRLCPFRGIILAPGWEHSKGCKRERALFKELGREVRYYREAVEVAP